MLLFGGGGGYRVTAILPDASQLVPGNLVKVGGVPVGTVKSIDLNEQRQAEVTLAISEERFKPLREGTRADVMYGSLSSLAGRVVALTPGPDDAAEIPDGGRIAVDKTRSPVEIDEVLTTLDAETRRSLQRLFHGSAAVLSGEEKAANDGLAALSPALQQTAQTVREVNRDQAAFERFIVDSAAVVSSVAGRDTDLREGLVNGAQVAGEIAAGDTDLSRLLAEAPPTLRSANTTLVNLRSALRDVTPAVAAARPVAPRLARTLRTLSPVTRHARPALRDLRTLLPDVTSALGRLPRLERFAVPALGSATGATRDTQPILSGLRSIYPDILAGPTNGFGGTTGGYYDANGGFVRMSVSLGGDALSGILNTGTPLQTGGGFTKHTARCGGGASQPAADGSNPFVDPAFPCDPGQRP